MTAKVKGGASGKLYGKVTGKGGRRAADRPDRHRNRQKEGRAASAIKEFGSYDASVRLYAGVVAPFKLKVEEL